MGVPGVPILGPLEEAAEEAFWTDYLEEFITSVPVPLDPQAELGTFTGPLRAAPDPVSSDYLMAELRHYEFQPSWEQLSGETWTDPKTGIVYPLDDRSAPFPPTTLDPNTRTWVINPDYLAYEAALATGHIPPDVQSVPAPDPPQQFAVAHTTPSWLDVFKWQSQQARADNSNLIGTQAVTGDQLQRALDVAMGTTTKALGGFISQVAKSVAALERQTANQIANVLILTTTAISNLQHRMDRVELLTTAILKAALPSLQRQIVIERHNRQVQILRQIEAQKVWTTDHVYIPLNTDIQQNQIEANTRIQAIHDGVPDQVRALAPELIAPALTAIAAVGTRVATLEAESDACVKPMCQTMGPTTDLGKFLKALKIAEWVALLAEIAALRADGLDGLLNDVEGWAATAIHDFETLFFSGGRTLGETIAGIV